MLSNARHINALLQRPVGVYAQHLRFNSSGAWSFNAGAATPLLLLGVLAAGLMRALRCTHVVGAAACRHLLPAAVVFMLYYCFCLRVRSPQVRTGMLAKQQQRLQTALSSSTNTVWVSSLFSSSVTAVTGPGGHSSDQVFDDVYGARTPMYFTATAVYTFISRIICACLADGREAPALLYS
jgi:hypothetical protein